MAKVGGRANTGGLLEKEAVFPHVVAGACNHR